MRSRSLFLFLILAAAIPAQTTTPTGIFEGIVINGITGEPVPRAKLTLRRLIQTSLSFTTPPPPYATTSNAEGKFRFDQVEPGDYNLSALRPGFVSRMYSTSPKPNSSSPLTIATGDESKPIQFKLTPQAVLTGRILDEAGDPVQNVSVQALQAAKGASFSTANSSGTNDIGEFRIANLNPGRYWLSATDRNNSSPFDPIPIVQNSGKPVEVYVTTYFPGSTEPSAAAPLDLTAGQTLSGIELRLKKATVIRVSGRLAGPAPARGITVIAVPRGVPNFGGHFDGSRSAPLKDDGTFELLTILPGAYEAIAFTASGGSMKPAARATFDASTENLSNLLLQPLSTLNLKGRVQLASGPAVPFEGLTLMLVPENQASHSAPNAPVDATGTFSFGDVAVARYQFLPIGIPPGLWMKSVTSGGRDLLETGIDLNDGPLDPIVVTLDRGVAQISGTVQDSKQQAVPAAVICLYSIRPNSDHLFRNIQANQHGQFQLTSLAPGDYRLIAWESEEPSDFNDPEASKHYQSKAKTISLKPNSSESLSLEVITPRTP